MDISVNIAQKESIDFLKTQKMMFLYNALEDGWEVKKHKDKYVFTKKHEGKKEVFLDSYVKQFIEQNFDINKILNN